MAGPHPMNRDERKPGNCSLRKPSAAHPWRTPKGAGAQHRASTAFAIAREVERPELLRMRRQSPLRHWWDYIRVTACWHDAPRAAR